ncbi:hypothetical protein HPP92_009949 [Vanilla planifolia]|uniref:Uncharacterized protein n=1 Tax=Vanilla planifolia TaxID=51239 RepID=A0A835QY14_VANPL|nr:hypothetical protein HPP92_009949 [Vanilla planifolia]
MALGFIPILAAGLYTGVSCDLYNGLWYISILNFGVRSWINSLECFQRHLSIPLQAEALESLSSFDTSLPANPPFAFHWLGEFSRQLGNLGSDQTED